MRIQNSSRWPDHFIRRMLSWCITEVDIERRWLRRAIFRKRTCAAWSGLGSNQRILVSIGPDRLFPMPWSGYKRAYRPADGSDYYTISDPLEALIAVTAHELGHVAHLNRGHSGRGAEDLADPRARYTLRRFREQRAELEAKWQQAPERIAAMPAPSAVERRASSAQAMLAKWQRKLKLAQGKVRKYARKVKRYQTVAA